jgi:hypothetical protein
MNTYYNISTGETREIDDAVYAAWVAAENPKAEAWLPLPAPPSHDSVTQHAPEWESGEWIIREKTEEEIASDSRKVWEHSAAFLSEFSVNETEAIANSTHPTVRRLLLRLSTWAGRVFSDDPHVSGGLDLLEAVGILTTPRKLEILTKPTP